MDELVQLCALLASPEKGMRQQAEERYKQLRTAADPSQLLRGLLGVASSPAATGDLAGATAKTMACVLLRQLFDSNFVGAVKMANIDPAVLVEMQQGLIAAVAKESNAEDRRKLCHVLAQAATVLPEESDWPELLQLTAQLMAAETVQHRETGFELLDKVAEYRAQLLVPFVSELPVPLLAGLQDAAAPTVRLAALKATCSVALEMGTGGVATFQPLINPLLRVLEGAIKVEDATAAQEAIATMSKLTEDVPKLWREALPQLGPMLATIIGTHAGIDCAVRIAAIEWVSTLAERLPARFRRGEWLAGALLPALMGLMNTSPPEEEHEHTWAQRPDSKESFADLHDGEDEEEDLVEAAALALDRLSRALGGKVMYKACAPLLLMGFQNNGDWTQRRGALLALAMLADGCDTSLQTHLPQLLPSLVGFAQDPHPRVRYAFLSCMTQLCEDLPEGPDGQPFQKKYGSLILPALTLSLADPGNQGFPRIQAAAAATVASFCSPDKCSPKVLVAHLEGLLQPLFGLLGLGSIFVKEEAMTAVATLAQVAEEAFSPFYGTFIPIAKQMLAESLRDSDGIMGLLGMKALEAFALMGDACGREKFRHDAHEVLQLMTGFHQQSVAAILANQVDGGELQHEATAYVMNSTARIGTALGAEFAPYLSNVLPLVLAAAAKRPNYHVQKVDGAIGAAVDAGDDVPAGDQKISVQLRGEGQFEIHVNSWEIQQREIAAQSLMHYVADLGSCLDIYLTNILQVVLELITPTATPEVRVCAYGMLPKLMRCSARKQDPALVNVLNEGITRLLTGLSRESELVDDGSEDTMEILCVGVDTLALCLEAGYDSARRSDWLALPLADALVHPLFELLQKLMVGTIRRRIAYQQETEVLDADDEDLLERREEWEQGLLNSCQETLGWVLRLKGEGAVPVFQALLDPLVAPLLSPGNALELRLLGMCMYIDVLEFGGRLGADVAGGVAALSLEFISSNDEDAQQTAAYAVGVLAQCGGEVFTPEMLAKMLPMLLAIVVPPETKETRRKVAHDKDDEDEADGCVRDNAISSVLRLCRYRGNQFDAQQLLHGGALRWLPLTEDLREAHSCHKHFVEWVNTGDPALFGEQGEHLPTMVKVLASLMVDPRSPDERASEAKLVDDGDAQEDEDKVFGEQYVSKQTRLDIEACFAKLQTAYPAEILTHIWASLPHELRQAVQTPTASVFTQQLGFEASK